MWGDQKALNWKNFEEFAPYKPTTMSAIFLKHKDSGKTEVKSTEPLKLYDVSLH